jgi:hypothetical protein
MPEPGPFGETLFEAKLRAMVAAALVNSPAGGWVESVVTLATHRFCFLAGTFLDERAVVATEPFFVERVIKVEILRGIFAVFRQLMMHGSVAGEPGCRAKKRWPPGGGLGCSAQTELFYLFITGIFIYYRGASSSKPCSSFSWHSMQWRVQGTASRRLALISVPQEMHSPKFPSRMRDKAPSTIASSWRSLLL